MAKMFDDIKKIDGKIEALNRRFSKKRGEIDNNRMLSSLGKQKAKNDLMSDYQAEISPLRRERETAINERRGYLRDIAFRPKLNTASDQMNYDRLLSDMQKTDLSKAVSTVSSEVTARAIARTAFDKGAVKVLNEVKERFPNIAADVDRLEEFETSVGSRRRMTDMMTEAFSSFVVNK